MTVQNLRGDGIRRVQLNDNFIGGINLTYADDVVSYSEFRQLSNYNIDNRGSLDKRKGFSENVNITEMIMTGVTTPDQIPFLSFTENSNYYTEILMLDVVQDDNNAWRELIDARSVSEYLQNRGADNNVIKIVSICKKSDKSMVCLVNKYTLGTDGISSSHQKIDLKGINSDERVLMSVDNVVSFEKIYITHNDGGLIIIDTSEDSNNVVTYCGTFTDESNSAYKPNALEVRKIGFNVLGDNPLTWIDGTSIPSETIQGMYVTNKDEIPSNVLPLGETFFINILFTGNKTEFTIAFKQDDKEITATVTKDPTKSTSSLAVYSCLFKTPPTGEVEIGIKFTDTSVSVAQYFDYYSMGTVDANAKPVEKLNVGKMKVVEIDSRLVFYGGDTIWFSELSKYDYIPNYNYLILPISHDDEIVKIVFFRTNYIIFTKKKIFKLNGTYGLDNFGRYLVNDRIGCVAPNSVLMINDELYFLSLLGLRSLKTDTFRENLENVKELDEKVTPLITNSSTAYAMPYEDTYVLFKNDGKSETVTFNYRDYDVPDAIKYYYNLKAFVSSTYSVHPRFIFEKDNFYYSLYGKDDTLSTFKVCDYAKGYTDFGTSYSLKFETAGINFGAPLHQKKIKEIIIKCGGGTLEQPTFLVVRADGFLSYNNLVKVLDVDENGTIVYSANVEPTVTIPPSAQEKFNKFLLSDSNFGSTSLYVRKIRVPIKCKNISIEVTNEVNTQFSVSAIGFTFKIGKVKE